MKSDGRKSSSRAKIGLQIPLPEEQIKCKTLFQKQIPSQNIRKDKSSNSRNESSKFKRSDEMVLKPFSRKDQSSNSQHESSNVHGQCSPSHFPEVPRFRTLIHG
eukprot:TRINITY_DN9872_c0_g2_i2.p2 TRINITY_DN9872_c0_g2~~TRINITY_DN9872_c0_g2_i2.p2  ORF type:complete len:104 (+),score=16.73 TRINITY_DN9872_c0_g2_i2:39-350(+)